MTEHVHHWRIDPPNGARSQGRCDCGAERSFANTEAGALMPSIAKKSASARWNRKTPLEGANIQPKTKEGRKT